MATEVHGFCAERFLPMRDAFRANFDAGHELGASLALTHQGTTVVDLWAGYADEQQTRLWERDTIVPVFSSTKIATTLSMLVLVDRGLVDLDTPVAYYWPEFAQGGKAAVTVRDGLSHQAGVPGFEPPVPWQTRLDWTAMTARLAAEPHWFAGERRVIYHSSTYGYLIGELIRRVDGRRPAQFFREEIALKSGADFQIVLTEESDLVRLAYWSLPPPPSVASPGAQAVAAEVLAARVRNSIGFAPPEIARSLEYLSLAENPGVGGNGNGRSIARICAIAAMGGELDGVRYLSRSMIEQAAIEQVYGECPLMGWIKFGLGFGLNSKAFRYPSPTTFGWGGFGGSWGIMDPQTGVSLGYTPNNLIVAPVDPRLSRFNRALRKLLPTL